MKTSDFNYHLPPEHIAQTPIEPRDHSRLLVLDRDADTLTDTIFKDVGAYLRPADLLVINQTRVIPARLHVTKPSGGKAEVLLLKRMESGCWEALVGGKGMKPGVTVRMGEEPAIEIFDDLGGSRRMVRFLQQEEDLLAGQGEMPLPPYIHETLRNPERYQTVYSAQIGSAAAPTAGLHFTPALMQSLEAQGVGFARVTLHVGLDTFAPVTEEDPCEHVIHSEWREVSPESAARINEAKAHGGRIIAVGTTSVRTLESAIDPREAGRVLPVTGPTKLFILPGYAFKVVDAMITNFHLPQSSLIMLVSAFAGRERVLNAYQTAIARDYRFYSFGDAMLIL